MIGIAVNHESIASHPESFDVMFNVDILSMSTGIGLADQAAAGPIILPSSDQQFLCQARKRVC